MAVNNVLVILMFVTFIGLLFSGFPIAWVLAGTAILFSLVGYCADLWLGTMTGLDFLTLSLSINRIFKTMSSWVLVALPMFIFMGLMLDRSGIAEKMMNAMQELFGKVRGGLAITVTIIGIILAASTGIIGASVVLLGLLSLPAMQKQGYYLPLVVGTIAGAGTLGILIPPSIMLVIMADQLTLSVGDLFMAALLPGLLLGCLYIVYLLVLGLIRPDQAPIAQDRRSLQIRMVWQVLKTILPPAVLIFAVWGPIFAGVATPTEASGIGALGATVLAWWNGKLSIKVIKEVLESCFSTTAYIFAIFIGATIFALVLRSLGGDELIEQGLSSIPFSRYGVIAVVLGVVFLLGFFLDWIEITLIILPLLAPAVSTLGFDLTGYDLDKPELIWFVILVAVTLQTSFLTPPVGLALFYLKGVSPPGIRMFDIYKGVVPFIILQLIGLGIILKFPQIVLWLPSVIYR